jgi:hypothetical protein
LHLVMQYMIFFRVYCLEFSRFFLLLIPGLDFSLFTE